MEPIWTSNPSILFASSTWQRFVPTETMDVPTALNAIVRFTVYASILLMIGTGRHVYLWSIPIVLAVTAAFAALFPTPRALVETFASRSERSAVPTAENPFMNPLLTDPPNRPDAPPLARSDVKQEVEDAFRQPADLYMDTSDRFDLAQSMRTFHTLQSATIPNDQDGFLKHLAKGWDAPDYSSAPPARHAKLASEGHLVAPGSMRDRTNTIDRPTGTFPRHSSALPSR